MARIINPNAPGRRRQQALRTVAELHRRLLQKVAVDPEVEDMLALIVISLREVRESVHQAAEVWDERGYWKKAASFETEWEWVGELAGEIETVLRRQQWDRIPELLVLLAQRTAQISIIQFTRPESLWRGCRDRLLSG